MPVITYPLPIEADFPTLLTCHYLAYGWCAENVTFLFLPALLYSTLTNELQTTCAF